MKILRGSIRKFASAVLLSGICSSAFAADVRREFTANPISLDFGTVQFGSSKQLTFTLRNIPVNAIGKVCSIKALTNKNAMTDITQDLFTATPASVTLSPNQQPTVQVFFTPTQDLATAFPSNLSAPPASVTGGGQVEVTCGNFSDGVRAIVKLNGTVPATPRFRLTVTRKGILDSIAGLGGPGGAFGGTIKTYAPQALLCNALAPQLCSSFVLAGTQISVRANLAANSRFVGWSGGTGSAAVCNGKTTLDCSFTMNADSNLTGDAASP